ncbi:MAG: hypothetical protein CSA81_01505 [Acidobacteria bacterium]|nr:MAG: hypothetical protein CSA81_01505 [Acidobacteriota bacterium]
MKYGNKRSLLQISGIFIVFTVVGTNVALAVDAVAKQHRPFPDKIYSVVEKAYRQFHEYPELGNVEFQTCEYIQESLIQAGFTQIIELPNLLTAVIAVWDTGREGPTIGLRSEMDARPTQEPAHHDPCSKINGVMHNCGHDIHAAILLGTAHAIANDDSAFRGKIVFVFQPAEEVRGGADDIVACGILKELGIQALFAQHVAPGTPVGRWTISPGAVMAGSNYFNITLKGQGSHAADPSAGSDLPLVAARLVETLSSIPARSLDILNQPMVMSVTQITTGEHSALNVIPTQVTLGGTIRAFYDLDSPGDNGKSARDVIMQVINGVVATYDVEIDFELRKATPPTQNHNDLFDLIIPQLQSAMAPGALKVTHGRGMFSEDFAYYTPHHPCLYFSLGVMKGEKGKNGVHTPEFDVHPDTLPQGLFFLWTLAKIASNSDLSVIHITE